MMLHNAGLQGACLESASMRRSAPQLLAEFVCRSEFVSMARENQALLTKSRWRLMLSGGAAAFINRKQLLLELPVDASVKELLQLVLVGRREGLWFSQCAPEYMYWNEKGLKIAMGLETPGRQQTSIFIFTEPSI